MFALSKLSMMVAFAVLPVAALGAPDDINSVHVRTSDIDLASASGKKILAIRISRAARDVCDIADDRLDLKIRKIERKCRDAAIASALAGAKISRRLSNR